MQLDTLRWDLLLSGCCTAVQPLPLAEQNTRCLSLNMSVTEDAVGCADAACSIALELASAVLGRSVNDVPSTAVQDLIRLAAGTDGLKQHLALVLQFAETCPMQNMGWRWQP